jgi:hypothetical protein
MMDGARGYLRDAASAAAHELGLFAALPCAAAALADRLRVRPRRLAALVRALLLEGVLIESEDVLRPGSIPPRRSLPGGAWAGLAEAIRSDRPLAGDGIVGAAGEELRRFHEHLWTAGASAAREVAERLGPRGPLLDLGGGAGTYAAAFLAANPRESATVVDRPAVLELAREAVPAAGRLALDLLGDGAWPAGARVALLANVLHLYGPREAAHLIARAAQAVLPGGTVAVKDFDPSSPAGIFFSVNLALFTEAGELHEPALLRSFLRDAGVRDVQLHRLRCAPEAFLAHGSLA